MKKIMNNLSFKNAYTPSKFNKGSTYIEMMLFLIAAFGAYFIFMYVDITNTIDNSVLFTKAVLSGNFFDFYDYTITHAATKYPANYEFLTYVPFAVWNIPLAIGNIFFGFDYNNSTIALLWAKGIIVLFSFAVIFIVYKTLRLCRIEKETAVLGCFTLSTSVMFFWPSFLIVQIDLSALTLILLGVYSYLKGRNKLFILFFALSIPFKMFGIFLFIPLLILKEKRIFFILLKTFLVMIPQLICKVLFIGSEAYNFALSSQSKDAAYSLLNFTNIIGSRKLSLFIVVFFAISIFCYIFKYDKDDKKIKYAFPLYICTLTYASLMIFVRIRGYWLVYLAPFIIISIFISGKLLKLNFLLEILSGTSFFLWYASSGGGAAKDNDMLWRLALDKFIDRPDASVLKYENLSGFISYYGLDSLKFLFFTVFVCSLLSILFITCLFFLKNHQCDKRIERGAVIIRPIALLMIIALYLYAYTATGNAVIYDTVNYEITSSNVDLLDNNSVSQRIEFDDDFTVEELGVVFENKNPARNNFSSVVTEIYNLSTDSCVFSKRIGCSMIKNGELTKIKLNKLEVNDDDTYEIRFSALKGVDENIINRKDSISVYKTESLIDKLHPAIENGSKKDYNLSIIIR